MMFASCSVMTSKPWQSKLYSYSHELIAFHWRGNGAELASGLLKNNLAMDSRCHRAHPCFIIK